MNERPWWAPDAQGFLATAIVAVCAIALFMRMSAPSVVDDKMLETMLTILFSTCLVTVYNYSFGSSRGSTSKDDTQNKVVEKMMLAAPPLTPPLQTLTTPLPTTTGSEVTSVSGTITDPPKVVDPLKPVTGGWEK